MCEDLFARIYLLSVAVVAARALCPFKCQCNEEELTVWCNGVDVVPITLNPDLRELRLKNNQIKSIMAAFTVYRNLQFLDMSHNQLVSLGKDNFALQKKLQVLHLNRNMVSALQNDSFAGLTSLRHLDLRENYLKDIHNGVFEPLSALQELDLSQNRLTKVHDRGLAGLTNLKTLVLRDNKFKHLPAKTFHDVTQLQTLDVGLNGIKVVSQHAFHALVELRELRLDGCEVHSVRRSAFKNLNQLQTLFLQNNELPDVPTVALQLLPRLEHLRLGQNNFQVIKAMAFRGLYNLRTLVINGAPLLDAVQRGAFADNAFLESLTFNYNKYLSFLGTGLLRDLPNLREVHLRGNALVGLSGDLLDWNRVTVFDVRDNPLICNCSLLWLRDFLRTATTPNNSVVGGGEVDFKQVQCNLPEVLRDVILADTSEDDLGCHRMFYLQIWALSALAAGVIVLAFVLVGLWYRTKVITYLKKKYPSDERVHRSKSRPDEEKIVPLVMRPKLPSVTEL